MNKGPEAVKVVLIGESGVGKTSIISRFIHDTFNQNEVTSLGASYISKTVSFPEYGKSIKFDIWDTAGQEKYRSLAKVFYKDAMIIILVYDITNRDSFEALESFWYKEIKDNILSKPIYAISANKSDLYEKEKVAEEEAKAFADKIDAIFKTTSASSNNGIDTLFTYIGKKYLDTSFNYKEDEEDIKNSNSDNPHYNNLKKGTKLKTDGDNKNTGKKCC